MFSEPRHCASGRRLRCGADESRASLLADPRPPGRRAGGQPRLDPESTRFREDLEADSLDLYTLVQELEDSYGVRISDEEASRILTVGQAVDFVLASGALPATAGQSTDTE